jgi:hypothetical protein
MNDFRRSRRSKRKCSILKDYLVFENFQCKKQSQEPLKSLKIFEIIYFSFLNIPFRGFVQKYPGSVAKIIFLQFETIILIFVGTVKSSSASIM